MARTLKSLLCLLLVVIMLVGCTPTSNPATGSSEPSTQATEPTETEPVATPPERLSLSKRLQQYAQLGSSPDDNYRTWYEIFVYSYCDTNGDGIGDLNGVISKLDELEKLGVNGIWLMPIHPSSSYHKYNVNDYYEIDPAYGTMADFDRLMQECNDRGIKVILDLVVNHTGNRHTWFLQACSYLRGLEDGQTPSAEECPYLDYYNIIPTDEVKYTGYSKIGGTDYSYECQFSSEMPDLNWANESMRSDVKDIMQFWLDKGVAGFRVDAALHFYTGKASMNIEVMNWLQETAESIKPDVYMVAEVWDSFTTITNYYESGFCSIFNYPFGNYNGKIVEVLNSTNPAKVATYATALEKAHNAYSGKNPDYIDAPFMSNHDVGRIYGFVNGNELKIKLAGAMNVFMSGSTFIYYGEEIGMPGSGNDPSKRAPMYWNASRDAGTTNLPPDCSLPEEGYPLGSLEEQKQSESSVYNYYREAIAIRNALPVISHGDTTAETALNVGTISAQRKTWNDEECIILMNISKEAGTVDLSDYADWKLVATLSADGNPIWMNGTTLEIAAYGVAVLIPNT